MLVLLSTVNSTNYTYPHNKTLEEQNVFGNNTDFSPVSRAGSCHFDVLINSFCGPFQTLYFKQLMLRFFRYRVDTAISLCVGYVRVQWLSLVSSGAE